MPASPGDPAATFRRELKVFRRIGVWFALLTGAIGFGGFFAVYSYVAPLATEVTRLPASAVPFALVAAGVGMTSTEPSGKTARTSRTRIASFTFSLILGRRGGKFLGGSMRG